MTYPLKNNTLTLKLNELPSYSAFDGEWKYPISSFFQNAILSNMECDQKTHAVLLSPEHKTLFKQNIVDKTYVVDKERVFTVKWKPTAAIPYGRRYPNGVSRKEKFGSLGTCPKIIKNTYFKKNGWTDFDFIKCHPSLMCELVRLSNVPIDITPLETYISDFKHISADFVQYYSTTKGMLTENDVKDLFNTTIYGGGFSTWVNALLENQGKRVKTAPKHPFYIRFKNCVECFRARVVADNPDFLDIIKTAKPDKSQYDRESCLMSYFLQCAENHCLYYAYTFMVGNGWIVDKTADLCYDGFTAVFTGKYKTKTEAIRMTNEHVKNVTGLAMRLTEKPYGEFLPYVVDESIVADDITAANIIITRLRGRLCADNHGRIFYKTGHIWSGDMSVIEPAIMVAIYSSGIYKAPTKKDADPRPYAQMCSGAKSIFACLCDAVRKNHVDVSIYEKFHTTTKGILCFKDGVLDFKNKRFVLWDDLNVDVYSTQYIHYDYCEYFNNPDRDAIAEVRNAIITNMFGAQSELALQYFARALAGHNEDKKWATYLGNRDCGKGVIYEALKHAFGEYVHTFELSYLLYARNSNADTSEAGRKLYWLMDLEFARLAISQEVPPPSKGLRLNSALLKKLCGGGDEHVARRNYDRRDTHFKTQFTPIIFGNNELAVDCNDVNEQRLSFSSVNQYKSAEFIKRLEDAGEDPLIIDSYCFADPDIKNKCRSDRWRDALVFLIYEQYTSKSVEVPKTDDDDVECFSFRKSILELYQITRNANDCELIQTVYDEFEDKKKVHNELVSMGVMKKRATGGEHKCKYVYVGLKRKTDVVVDADADDATTCETIE